jgi:hypothetical protein
MGCVLHKILSIRVQRLSLPYGRGSDKQLEEKRAGESAYPTSSPATSGAQDTILPHKH